MRNKIKIMKFFGGIVNLKLGIDGLVIDVNGEWIYYGVMVYDGLFKVSIVDLLNE